MRTAVNGDGEGRAGVDGTMGARENNFWRVTAPRRDEGRDGVDDANVGPAASPSNKFTSSRPCSLELLLPSSEPLATGEDGRASEASSESMEVNGCFDPVTARGFSRSVVDTVRHSKGSATFKRRNALYRILDWFM